MAKSIGQTKEEMITRAADKAISAASGAKEAAETTRKKPWFHVLARAGYAVRGLLYGVIGLLAIQLLLFGRGDLAGREGALETIDQQPFGEVALIFVAVGLFGMALWGVIRAVADADDRGNNLKGLIARAGQAITGLSYGVLLSPTLNLIFRSENVGKEGQQAREAATGILSQGWGPWLVGIVGVLLIVIGGNRIRNGLRSKLDERLKTYKMTAEQLNLASRAGRIGAIAQGSVMIVIGVLFILAALTLDPNKVSGMDGALTFLASQPYGPYLLGFIAAGLIAYAVYSFMGALWFRVED